MKPSGVVSMQSGMVRVALVLVISCALIFPATSMAEDHPATDQSDTSSFFNRKNVITYGIVAHTVFTTYVEYEWWWKGDYHPFQLRVEGFLKDYSLGVDKFGHLYTSYFYFNALHNLMKWGGYDESTNLWVSSLIPALYAVSIEIGDGYSTYQFAPDDLAFNLTGIGFGLIQAEYPFFNNFKVKWSYYPDAANRNSFKHPFSDDYDGHIYWLSMNIHGLLPEGAKSYWPRFLNLAVGYGGQNISKGFAGPPLRKFAVSLDYNLVALPLEGDTWNVVKNIVDLFHFPAPGIRFVPTEQAEFTPLLTR